MNPSRSAVWGANAFPSDVRHVFDRLFQHDESDASNVPTGQWAPRVDIKEEERRFVIFVDVPGVDPSSIEVSMDKGVLSIKGERAVEKSEQNSRFTRVERAHGRFHRRFTLPDSADAENVSATGKHGVLEIAIPKRAQVAPRRITIHTAQ
ncbi:Hsp20/alpha crystallin family protein [Dyella mobilis]|uniref:Hsp20/alpha crystallin family protein n=1 Tax=Dyella mobilis TaxID=1849582 RepID=A0ABS2KI84_9GAMM|nr:Hsp20/alpha crystallin family protein [Dyella mobilis]MBM7130890.1 Hsp20/alpha crystallin family protein [Dyella mobilis]GLQ97519.1 heat-shock protein [Dyella mobilis]